MSPLNSHEFSYARPYTPRRATAFSQPRGWPGRCERCAREGCVCRSSVRMKLRGVGERRLVGGKTMRQPAMVRVDEQFFVIVQEDVRLELLDLKAHVIQNPAVVFDRFVAVPSQPPSDHLSVVRQRPVGTGRHPRTGSVRCGERRSRVRHRRSRALPHNIPGARRSGRGLRTARDAPSVKTAGTTSVSTSGLAASTRMS